MIVYLPLLLIFSLSSHLCDGSKVNSKPSCSTSENRLKDILPFKLGVALNSRKMKYDERYSKLAMREFNSITPENAMKFKNIHPSAGKYNWTESDYFVNLAQDKHIRIHGHTLIWSKSNPKWLNEFTGDSARWERLLKEHISNVVSRYKNRVGSWDVVNEAFDDNGNYRKSLWTKHLGNGCIGRSFIYAHQADPKALLFYNDYGQEYNWRKRQAINNLIKDLKNRNIPIHGIGLQLHTRIGRSENDYVTALKWAASTGLLVHISELDISMNPQNNKSNLLNARLSNIQADRFSLIFKLFNQLPKEQQFGVTVWGLRDSDSWMNRNKSVDHPLLFDRKDEPKTAYLKLFKQFIR
jgi:endo-1,4-beta-xylanase